MDSLRLALAALLTTCCVLLAEAQFAKTMHTSIEADSVSAITVDLQGDVSVESWDGNTVLVETSVKLYNASKGVFEYFVERAGRYDVLTEASAGGLRIYSKDTERKIIQTKNGTSSEEVVVIVRLPKEFEGTGNGPYVRAETDPG